LLWDVGRQGGIYNWSKGKVQIIVCGMGPQSEGKAYREGRRKGGRDGETEGRRDGGTEGRRDGGMEGAYLRGVPQAVEKGMTL